MKKNARELVNFIWFSLVFFILGFSLVIPVFTRKFGENNDFTVKAADSGWWTDTGYDHCKKITFNADAYISGGLNNFPMLVHIENDLDLHNNMSDSSDGDEILFSMNGDNETKLSHEIEYWNDDVGGVDAEIWVNVTSVGDKADTIIWMYYGKSVVSSNENIVDTWDNGYVGVWHLGDIAGGTVYDSLGVHDSTRIVDLTDDSTGKVGHGGTFSEGYAVLTYSSALAFSIGDDFTITAWVKTTDDSNNQRIFTCGDGNGNSYYMTELRDAGGGADEDHLILMKSSTGGSGHSSQSGDGTMIVDGTWHHVTGIYKQAAGDDMLSYLNGTLDASHDTDLGGTLSGHDVVYIGRAYNSNNSNYKFNGDMDEVRVSNVARSTDWMKTEFHTSNITDGFLTIGDDIEYSGDAPEITINFAGNFTDSGGPYYRPPGETTQLTGAFSDGYFANNSKQSEEGIEVNCTITDATTVYLDWLNETTWLNGTYTLSNTAGDYWEIDTSGTIQTCEGYNYSFNINATGGGGSTIAEWNKTTIGGDYTRRYVQLNCTPVNISYTPFYLIEAETYAAGDLNKKDRFMRDSAPDGTVGDTGYLRNYTLTDTMQLRYCSAFNAYFFDDDICVQSFTLDSVYWHLWGAENTGDIMVKWKKTREEPTAASTENLYFGANRSNIYWDNGQAGYSNDYFLKTGFFDVTNTAFTDNNIYELLFVPNKVTGGLGNPSTICNISIQSFFIPNVPDDIMDGTDNSTDSDSDGLSDHMELNITHGYHTNPFDDDTDNDGVSDYLETITGSDPNNWSDTTDLSWKTESGFSFCGNNATTWMENKGFSFSGNNVSTWFEESGFSFSGNNITSWVEDNGFSFSGNNITIWSEDQGFSFQGGNISLFNEESSFSFQGNNISSWFEESGFSFSGNNITFWIGFGFSFSGNNDSLWNEDKGFSFKGNNISSWFTEKGFSFSGNNITSWADDSGFSFQGNNLTIWQGDGFSFSGNNGTIFTSDASFSFSGNNISSFHQDSSFSFSGNNITSWGEESGFSFSGNNISSWFLDSGFSFSGNNETVMVWQEDNGFSFSGNNVSLWNENASFSFQGGNVSEGIIVNLPEPANESNVYDIQPVLCFNLTSIGGYTMNYTILIGNSTENCTYILITVNGVNNGTYCYNNYTNATVIGETYYWKVSAEDGTNEQNETYHFTLSVTSSGYIISGGNTAGVVALGAGSLLFLFIGVFFIRRRKKNGNNIE